MAQRDHHLDDWAEDMHELALEEANRYYEEPIGYDGFGAPIYAWGLPTPAPILAEQEIPAEGTE